MGHFEGLSAHEPHPSTSKPTLATLSPNRKRPGVFVPRFPLPRVLTVLGILAICLGASSNSCSFGGKDDPSSPDFVTELKLQNADGEVTDTFDRGETVTLVLTVRNRLDSRATVEFTTGRTFDFVVVRENSSNVVWKWSANQPPFSTKATELEFEPYETKTFTREWNQVDDGDSQVPRATYDARGVLVYSNFDRSPLESNQLGSSLSRLVVR